MLAVILKKRPQTDQEVQASRADLGNLQPWVATCENSHFVAFGGRSVGDIKKSFARAVEEAGLSSVTAYCLRSTMATELRTPVAFLNGRSAAC
jgi:hypothetical protein